MRVGVKVSYSELDLEDFVSIRQARGVIVNVLQEAVCHRQHKLRGSVKREVCLRVLDIRNERCHRLLGVVEIGALAASAQVLT